MNNVLIGSVESSATCDCSTEPLRVTFDDDATLPVSDPGLCDVYRVAVRNGGAAVRFGEVSVSVATENGELDGCLFDGSSANPAPTCASRSLCSPPAFTDGVATVTGSVCPVCGGGAGATVAHQDVDGDRVGNTCDDQDRGLGVSRASIRGDRHRTKPSGAILLKGEVGLASMTGPFHPAAGVTIRVTDGFGFDERFDFTAADCHQRTSGYVSCKTPDRPWRASFAPHGRPRTGFRFTVSLNHLTSSGPFQSYVNVWLTTDPSLPIEGIDRAGVVGNCIVSQRGMRCRAP